MDPNSSEKDLTDTISDYLSYKKNTSESHPIDLDSNIIENCSPTKQEVFEVITQQLNKLENASKEEKGVKTPPPSPAEYKFENNIHVFEEKFRKGDLEKGELY